MLKKSSGFVELLRHAKNYLAADVASKAVGFISIPVFTRLLDPADYGIYSVFFAYAGLIAVILTLNAHTSVGRYFYEEKGDFDRFFGTSVAVVLITLCCSAFFILTYRREIASLLALTDKLVLLLIPFTVVEVFFSFFCQIFIPQRQSGLVARVNCIRVYVSFFISVALLPAFREQKYLALVLGQLIGGGVLTYYLARRMQEYFTASLNLAHVRYICSYSLPLLFYTLNGAILNQADRLMINKYCGAGDAGLYSLSYNLGLMLTLLWGALLTAWTPNYFEHMNSGAYDKLRGEIEMMLKIITCAAIGLILLGKDFGMLLSSEKYHTGLFIVPIITLGCFFDAVWQLYGRHIGYSRKTIYLTYLGIFSAATNVGLNMYFIPMFGYQAAAYTTLTSFFLMAASAVAVTKYVLNIYPVSVRLLNGPLTYIGISLAVFYWTEWLDTAGWFKLSLRLAVLVIIITCLGLPALRYRAAVETTT